MDSPLLYPVTLENDTIIVFDETLPPFKEEYIPVKTIDQALWVLKEMKTRSLGQVLLFFYSCVLFQQQHSVDELARMFKQIRPTFDFFMLAHILNGQLKKGAPIKEAVLGFIKGFEGMRRGRAARIAQMLPNPAHILTVCNVNGELIYVVQALQQMGKSAKIYASETRPYLQGTRLTFWELHRNNIECIIICDNQVGQLMSQGKVNCAIVVPDRATTQGGVINKIGTYPIARLAKHFNIPFYALTQYPRDIDIESITIEERPAAEVFMYLNQESNAIDAVYPAFDVTPAEYVTSGIDIMSASGRPV